MPVWVVSRYADARAALADPRLRKDAVGLRAALTAKLAEAGRPTELSGLFNPHMLNSDPPDHSRLRRLLARDFTARRVAELRPRVAAITTELVDALPTGEPVDLIDGLAFPLPITVICELLGVPVANREQFRAWSTDLVAGSPERTMASSGAMAGYFVDLIGRKRADPGDDLLSALTLANSDGDRLSGEELLGTAFLLLVAGHETTVNLIGNGAHALLRDPHRWRRLHDDPALLPGAIEELLRFDSPVRTSTPRFTSEPVDIGSTVIPANDLVLVALGSANRDADRFERPDEVDLHRPQGGHLAFGHGIHYCLGAPLARLEAEVALGLLTERFPLTSLAVAEGELRRQPSAIMNGFRALPVVLA
ncbi:cytochrome P450 [Solihabitans fulvus]|uniref:Cytochrome P450 n=2 Tax=Solihabitans fulvus TaxID=1892852 RepID=A0A5B2XKM3_9PSEU|nr:cytochrome P450 [Solihabitans fulvus]